LKVLYFFIACEKNCFCRLGWVFSFFNPNFVFSKKGILAGDLVYILALRRSAPGETCFRPCLDCLIYFFKDLAYGLLYLKNALRIFDSVVLSRKLWPIMDERGLGRTIVNPLERNGCKLE